MSKDEDITLDKIEDALEKMENEESIMSRKAILLRDAINKKLSRKGYHLRIAYLKFSKEELVFNFVEPIHNWFNELLEVHYIVIDICNEARRNIK